MDTFLKDLRYGLRMLRKSPGFTAVVVLTLALGIGVNSAIFSVVNGMILFSLPYADSDRLIQIWSANAQRGWNDVSISYPDWLSWRKDNRSFEDIVFYYGTNVNLSGLGEPERIHGVRASANIFSVLGRNPAHGRGFRPEEETIGTDPVVIISNALWQRSYGGDPEILGKTIELDGAAHAIIGIMPPDFYFSGRQTDVLLPHKIDEKTAKRGSRGFNAVGRLKSTVTLAQARADLSTIAARLARDFPDSNEGWSVNLVPLRKEISDEDTHLVVLTIYLAVIFVLLIACANVANLLLARAAGREKEIAIRMALGGGRRRLLRQLLTESILLALLGGIGGILVSYWGIQALLTIAPSDAPNVDKIQMDQTILLYTVGLSLLTGVIFGLAPAWQSTRARIQNTLKEGGRTSAGGQRHRLLRTLVVAEVALALVLLVCGGLMVRSFIAQMKVDPGFDTEEILTLSLTLPEFKYKKPIQWATFFKDVEARVQSIPGVDRVGAVQTLPLDGNNSWRGISIEGRAAAQPGERLAVGYLIVTPDYFRAMGIHLLRGRFFTAQDGAGRPGALINQTMARRYWPDDPSPLGRQIRFGGKDSKEPWIPIVGIVADVIHQNLGSIPRPEIYVPHSQDPARKMTLVVRTRADPLSLAQPVRDAIWGIDSDLPVYAIRTMRQVVDYRVQGPKATAQVMGFLAGLALILAAVGIYGVVAHSVSERTHEIGVRMALGAQHRDIFRMVIGRGMLLVGIGLLVGLAGAFASMRVLQSVIFKISPSDPPTYITISIILLIVAGVASFVPARRATGVDPVDALRCE